MESAVKIFFDGLRNEATKESAEVTFTVIEKEEVKIGEYKFLRQLIGIEGGDQGLIERIKLDSYFVEEGGLIFTVSLLARNSAYKKDRLPFLVVLKSFKVE